MNTQTKHSLMLMLCAFIWGTAFVAQSAGSGMGAYSFLAGRSWLAVLVLLPTVRAFDALHRRHGAACGWPKAPADRKLLLMAGALLRHFAVCGLRCPADRHHAQPFHGQGWFPDRHVCGAGAGVRAVSGAAGAVPGSG